MSERIHKEVDRVIAHIYRNRPRPNTDNVIKISNYEIPRSDEKLQPGACWVSTFNEASNAPGHDMGAVLTSPKNAHKPYTKSMVNGIPSIQN